MRLDPLLVTALRGTIVISVRHPRRCLHRGADRRPRPPLQRGCGLWGGLLDIIHDETMMGGEVSALFDGDPARCDQDPENFWEANATTVRAATVILRRGAVDAPAGLCTSAGCGAVAEGTASPSTFTYDDIFVR